MNGEIRNSPVRLIGVDGKQIGSVDLSVARRTAEEQGFDLVEISPSICRIMDYGRFVYETEKKEKESRKNSKSPETKEIRLSPSIAEHDLKTKVNSIKRILSEGDKVKVSVFFKGREMAHPELGMENLKAIALSLTEFALLEKPPIFEGKSVWMVLKGK